ncbi:agroclavine dehydrogenase [Mycena epipterygia]|nr:agroclavine dehydrogenase [Mycena epipterygia]
MTILLTGGTGKSATPLAKLLLQAKQHVLLATRSGKVPAPFTGVQFDWLDASTYKNPFEADGKIDRIYLVAPPVFDMLPPMKAFIDFAIEKGVRRFVLMGAALLDVGGPMMGQVHEYLASLSVEYCVLRPSWFFDNLVLHYANQIKNDSAILNAAGDGLIGWISTDDIADVALKALLDPVISHTNPIMVGPEILSYAQIAKMFTEILGREIKHKNLTEEECRKVLIERGMPETYAVFMSGKDIEISEGAEERAFKRADFVGKRKLRDFIETHKDAEAWRVV